MHKRFITTVFLSTLSMGLIAAFPASSQSRHPQASPTKDQLLERLKGKKKHPGLGRTRGIQLGAPPKKNSGQKKFLKNFIQKSRTRSPILPGPQLLKPKEAAKATEPFLHPLPTTTPTPAIAKKAAPVAAAPAVVNTTASERQKLTKIIEENELPAVDLVIYFDYNSAAISARSIPDLVKLGQVLRNPELAGSTFLVAGHTDASGGAQYNLSLSQRRAQSVQEFLRRSFDIDKSTLVAVGYGEEQLKNHADPKAAENRRVQIVNLATMQ